MVKKKLKVIPKPNDSSTIIFGTHDNSPLVKGFEPESYACGNCDFILLENIINYNFDDIVFQCPNANPTTKVIKNI